MRLTIAKTVNDMLGKAKVDSGESIELKSFML